MKKKIPEQLARRQEQQRQETINKIMWALDELESMGMDETLRNLMALTGLSHSVFYKPHVKEFIAGYCPGIYTLSGDEPEVKESKRRTEQEAQIERLNAELEALQHENELLRGKLFFLMKDKNE